MNSFDTERKSVRVFRVHDGRRGYQEMNRIVKTCSLAASITGCAYYPQDTLGIYISIRNARADNESPH
jgi:hypothetical protein